MKFAKLKKAIMIILALALFAGISAGVVIGTIAGLQKKDTNKYQFESCKQEISGDKIHFLNVGQTDAILLESDGKFALIDAGEDNDNPTKKSSLELQGYEEEVVKYIKKIATSSDGKVYLDFVLGTHSHSDHIGGMDTVILDDDIVINKAYLKRYDESRMSSLEQSWDNEFVYANMVNACKAKNIPLIQDFDTTPFILGNMKLSFYNTEYDTTKSNADENRSSVVVLVEANGKRALLAGDLNLKDNIENKVAKQVGKIDLLKVGHHGIVFSTSLSFVKTLKPKIAIVTNQSKNVSFKTKSSLTLGSRAATYYTVNESGIVAVLNSEKIGLYNNSMK